MNLVKKQEWAWVKYLDKNYNENDGGKLRKQKAVDLESLKEFKQAIESFFPQDGKWYSSCFNQPKDLNYQNLPCHLQDINWMSKLLSQELGGCVSQSAIKKFMRQSAAFTRLKHDYELRIVQWQINWIMDGGENWLLPKGFDELSLLTSPDIDKMVRSGVVKTLRAIGMNHEVVEEGLEKYAHQWRKASMEHGYNNLFNPAFAPYLMDEISSEQEAINEAHKANWVADREYKYYQEHKSMVDKYGTPTPAMKMAPAEHAELLTVLNQQNTDRTAYMAAKKAQWQSEQGKTYFSLKREDAEPARKKTARDAFGSHLIKGVQKLIRKNEKELSHDREKE